MAMKAFDNKILMQMLNHLSLSSYSTKIEIFLNDCSDMLIDVGTLTAPMENYLVDLFNHYYIKEFCRNG